MGSQFLWGLAMTYLNWLVSVDALGSRLDESGLVLLDASMPPPGSTPDPSQPINTIKNARRFDIDTEFSDTAQAFPHMLPSPDVFSQKAQALGINNDSTIVVFDNQGMFSAPRAWWMFRAMGHDKVLILDGGMPAWQQAGFECDTEYHQAEHKGNFVARLQTGWFVAMNDIEKATRGEAITVVDARSADRFYSRVDEPRPGIRRGNIPSSINLPFDQVLIQGHYKSSADIEQEFKSLGINKNDELYFSCGSGVTACIDAVAARLCGFEKVSVYDGSWCEWASCKSE